ncbi:MAG: hypothetical protein A2135_09440 [Actinobacteria bacterium RBG_16_67_15]|nr:MAG: hypothetical protein A2135_09440 [Actinobacteria bacterium RBG_16_67_15]
MSPRRPEIGGGGPTPTPSAEPGASLALWDWRRSVADLYAEVRRLPPREGWEVWVTERRSLLRTHPQSPVTAPERPTTELPVFPYDPTFRLVATVEAAPTRPIALPMSAGSMVPAHAFGLVHLELGGTACDLTLFWLEDYAGGVFLPFRDSTNGISTYGGGRYLLDTAKGADLGGMRGEVVLDFNFAYHPSCAYDPGWSCPLAPTENHLPVAVEAGERLA